MDKNFMDRFNFIFGTVQTVLLIVAIVIAFTYVAKFSHSLGSIETRISILELQNPIE